MWVCVSFICMHWCDSRVCMVVWHTFSLLLISSALFSFRGGWWTSPRFNHPHTPTAHTKMRWKHDTPTKKREEPPLLGQFVALALIQRVRRIPSLLPRSSFAQTTPFNHPSLRVRSDIQQCTWPPLHLQTGLTRCRAWSVSYPPSALANCHIETYLPLPPAI